MLRDNIKDREYFQDYINYENSRIEKFSKKLESLIINDPENKTRINSIANYISNFYKNKIVAMYSLGSDLDEIRLIFKEYLNYIENYGIKTYSEMLDILSLTILFNVEKLEIKNTLKNDDFDDGIILWLKSIIEEEKVEKINQDLKYPNQYSKYVEIINEKNKETAVELLKDFLNDSWYSLNEDMSWHDTHKSKTDVYNGYWSWLSAVIIKVKGLEDYNLENIKYLPDSLV